MLEIIRSHKPSIAMEVFLNLWNVDRLQLWESTISDLVNIYKVAILVTDGNVRKIDSWSQSYLSGGMQTLIFGLELSRK